MILFPRAPLSPRNATRAALVAAAFVGIGPQAAQAADCKITVRATPQVVFAGQSANVDVLAFFPPTAYAFASSQFDVLSTFPAWTFITAGGVVGDDVLGISASQNHQPQLGQPANPANPFRVWRGVLTPGVNAPALIEIEADPTDFFVYPSPQTSSSAPCDGAGGSAFVMANPLPAGRWLAAPGRGTEIEVSGVSERGSDDIWVDGRIITGENPSTPILMGLLLPAIQKRPDSDVRVNFDGLPQSLSVGVEVEADSVPTDSFSLNFTKIEFQNAPAAFGLKAGGPSGTPSAFRVYRKGARLVRGELPPDTAGPNPAPPAVIVDSIAPRVGMRLQRIENPRKLGARGRLTWKLTYDAPVAAAVRDSRGELHSVVIDTIEVDVPLPGTGGAHSSNIKQLLLGLHTFETTGARAVQVMPVQPR